MSDGNTFCCAGAIGTGVGCVAGSGVGARVGSGTVAFSTGGVFDGRGAPCADVPPGRFVGSGVGVFADPDLLLFAFGVGRFLFLARLSCFRLSFRFIFGSGVVFFGCFGFAASSLSSSDS